jgi:hypothetical protein
VIVPTAKRSAPARANRASSRSERHKATKLPIPADDNVVREAQSKGTVRPDGPGDETSPVTPTPARSKS